MTTEQFDEALKVFNIVKEKDYMFGQRTYFLDNEDVEQAVQIAQLEKDVTDFTEGNKTGTFSIFITQRIIDILKSSNKWEDVESENLLDRFAQIATFCDIPVIVTSKLDEYNKEIRTREMQNQYEDIPAYLVSPEEIDFVLIDTVAITEGEEVFYKNLICTFAIQNPEYQKEMERLEQERLLVQEREANFNRIKEALPLFGADFFTQVVETKTVDINRRPDLGEDLKEHFKSIIPSTIEELKEVEGTGILFVSKDWIPTINQTEGFFNICRPRPTTITAGVNNIKQDYSTVELKDLSGDITVVGQLTTDDQYTLIVIVSTYPNGQYYYVKGNLDESYFFTGKGVTGTLK